MTRILALLLIFPFLLISCNAEKPQVDTKHVSSLVDPGKLSTLKSERAGNPRFRKLMFYIAKAESQGVKPKDYLNQLYSHLPKEPYSMASHVYAPETEKLNLEAQYRLGRAYGLYTPDNLVRLRKGNSPIITVGKYSGEKAHVDHLLPRSKYPQLENSMANLTWLPASQNLRKSDKVTNAAIRRLKALREEISLAQ